MWITREQAAAVLECSSSTVGRLVAEGRLEPRPRVPSLSLTQVTHLARRRLEDQLHAEQEAASRRRRRTGPTPPDEEHVWLRGPAAAWLLGVSASGITRMVQRGALPCVVSGQVRWFRQDVLETFARNRRAGRRRAADRI